MTGRQSVWGDISPANYYPIAPMWSEGNGGKLCFPLGKQATQQAVGFKLVTLRSQVECTQKLGNIVLQVGLEEYYTNISHKFGNRLFFFFSFSLPAYGKFRLG